MIFKVLEDRKEHDKFFGMYPWYDPSVSVYLLYGKDGKMIQTTLPITSYEGDTNGFLSLYSDFCFESEKGEEDIRNAAFMVLPLSQVYLILRCPPVFND